MESSIGFDLRTELDIGSSSGKICGHDHMTRFQLFAFKFKVLIVSDVGVELVTLLDPALVGDGLADQLGITDALCEHDDTSGFDGIGHIVDNLIQPFFLLRQLGGLVDDHMFPIGCWDDQEIGVEHFFEKIPLRL